MQHFFANVLNENAVFKLTIFKRLILEEKDALIKMVHSQKIIRPETNNNFLGKKPRPIA